MQLVVISGKGGTGKTTIAAALAAMFACQMTVDCDVDAANLQLLLGGKDLTREDFSGAKQAKLDSIRCKCCNRCGEACRFGAIRHGVVDDLLCEGCGACVHVCTQDALTLVDQVTGSVLLTQTTFGLLSRAEMLPGADGSGKLVTKVRAQGFQAADDPELIILDGPPGIGCPAIATLTGCDAALVVLEPSYSGQHDFLRLLKLLRRFDIKAFACINRCDLSPELCQEITNTCAREEVPVIGMVPFDPLVNEAQRETKTILAYETSPAKEAIHAMGNRLRKLIGVKEQ